MVTTQALTIEPDQAQLLNELAASQFRSPEVLVREAVNQYLAQQQPDAVWDSYDGPRISREEFLADAKAAKRDLDKTGLHLTHAEVTEWVERLRTDPGAKLPECHT